jgi:enolase
MHIGVPLYRYLGGAAANTLPIPMMNILNGGAHSNNNLDIQEFMIVPNGAQSVTESIRMGTEVFHTLKGIISSAGYSTALGDEGGFAPELPDEFAALDLIVAAIEKAGYRPGQDISIALDVASSEWYRSETSDYYLPKSKRTYCSEDLLRHLTLVAEKYPIISIEDGMGENDIEGWKLLSQSNLGKIMLVGDDLFVTNKERLMMGVENGIGNSILIKPNQIGTVSEVIDTIQYAKAKNYRTVMSHRSGETADTFIADFAVAMGSEFIKTGAPSRSERTEKYNRLMRIENELFSPVFSKEFI